jgi:hypothetical protein
VVQHSAAPREGKDKDDASCIADGANGWLGLSHTAPTLAQETGAHFAAGLARHAQSICGDFLCALG